MNNKLSQKNKGIPLLTVVMLNYNGLKYLKRTIPPILKLNYPNYESIIVDNGSTDGSLEFIKKFKKIKLIRSPRIREKNFACNYSIERAKGKYILLLDNDALLQEKTILQNLLKRYFFNEKTGVIGLSFYEDGFNYSKSYGGYLGYYFIRENKNIRIKDLKKYDNVKISFPEGKGLFFSKKVWKQVGGYDNHLSFGGDDSDLGIKLWLMGYKNYLYSKTLQIHLGLPERQDNKKYSLKWKEIFYANMYTIIKNYSFKNMLITILNLSLFGLIKSIKQSISRLHPGPFLAFFQGYYMFLKNIPHNIKKRKQMQYTRIIKEDIFLKIKPPSFN